ERAAHGEPGLSSRVLRRETEKSIQSLRRSYHHENDIDHIAIGCESLSRGVQDLEKLLSSSIPLGVKHPVMSTPSCVMRTGE
ncbi:MAG: hypothetical protein AAF458_03795, partial [Pseudomonadota bacterium]